MNSSAVFIQVRLSSQRLPGKALLPLAGYSVITHTMRALAELPVDHYVLLTDGESAPRLREEAASSGYQVFVGDPDDVLYRYVAAARHYDVAQIIRATGDNPLTSSTMARQAMQLQESTDADYAGITGTPYGTGVEVVKTAALADLHSLTTDGYDREHVTPGLYRRQDRYTIVTRPAPAALQLPEMRVTLDTVEDYHYIAGIYRDLYRGKPIGIAELIAYGQRQHVHSA
ncbi:MAG: cytidylyltransferase domain-containing protein [Alkalispirochaeta sp.]